MEIIANIIAIFMLVVTVSSIVTAVTPTPQEGWKKKLRRCWIYVPSMFGKLNKNEKKLLELWAK